MKSNGEGREKLGGLLCAWQRDGRTTSILLRVIVGVVESFKEPAIKRAGHVDPFSPVGYASYASRCNSFYSSP